MVLSCHTILMGKRFEVLEGFQRKIGDSKRSSFDGRVPERETEDCIVS